MNETSGYLSPTEGFYHGAHLVFVDGLGCGNSPATKLKRDAIDHLHILLEQWGCIMHNIDSSLVVTNDDNLFGIAPFCIKRGKHLCHSAFTVYSSHNFF